MERWLSFETEFCCSLLTLSSSPNIYLVTYKHFFYYCFADLQNQPGTYNLDNQHFPRDASNHANFEEATVHPHDGLSNGSYLEQQTICSDQIELQVENNTEGMETQMNTCMSFSSRDILILHYQYHKGSMN